MENPESIISRYTYDPKLDRYIYSEKVGAYDITYPIILTPEQYLELVRREDMKSYFKEKIDAYSGKKEGSEEARKNLLPNFYVNNSFFESIFGGNTIEVVPQGSVAMDLGIIWQKNDNPALSPRVADLLDVLVVARPSRPATEATWPSISTSASA